MVELRRWLARLARDERGATLIEYGLMLALIAIVCATAAGTLGGNARDLYQTAANLFP